MRITVLAAIVSALVACGLSFVAGNQLATPVAPQQEAAKIAAAVDAVVVAATPQAASKGYGTTPGLAPKTVVQPVPPRFTPTPQQAENLALADLLQIPDYERCFQRYIWVEDGIEPEDAQAINFTINTDSRASTIYQLPQARGGYVLLLRVDLRLFAPRQKDLADWLRIWEEFQFDPRFATLLEGKTLAAALYIFKDWEGECWVSRKKTEVVECPPYVHTDGQTYHAKNVTKRFRGKEKTKFVDMKDVELVKFVGHHLDQDTHDQLVFFTGSQAPVVSDGYFTYRALATIKDKGIYETIYGGLYYDLAGNAVGKNGQTDEDALLASFGLANADKLFNDLRSDQRVAIFRSQVTGQPRRMDFFRGAQGRVDLASGLISFSHDLKNQDIGVATHPLLNLLNFKDEAREVIFETRNGMHGYDLFNGAGKRQVEVPPDVARDGTIPMPHTAKLQPAIGCIACHEAEGSDGWKAVYNDVKKLTAPTPPGLLRLDIFGDEAFGHHNQADVLDRLVGLYDGNPERALQRGRDDYATATLKATGVWRKSKTGQTDVIKLTGTQVVNRWRRYWYDIVTPKVALYELGIAVTEDAEALRMLRVLLPPDLRAGFVLNQYGQKVVREDPRIYALLRDIGIPRSDWDLAFAFASERANRTLAALKGKMP